MMRSFSAQHAQRASKTERPFMSPGCLSYSGCCPPRGECHPSCSPRPCMAWPVPHSTLSSFRPPLALCSGHACVLSGSETHPRGFSAPGPFLGPPFPQILSRCLIQDLGTRSLTTLSQLLSATATAHFNK